MEKAYGTEHELWSCPIIKNINMLTHFGTMRTEYPEDSFFGRIYAGVELSNDDPDYPSFVAAIERARAVCAEYNEPKYKTREELNGILGKLLQAEVDPETVINPPFYCDVGFNIDLGKCVRINTGCVFLDSNRIIIGNYVMIGPNVTIVTPDHTRDPEGRRNVGTVSKPVIIEDDAWIGTGAIILPGVRIGRGAIVGAGAVVTKDVPAGTTAVGNPARPIGGK